jgi:acyl-coenzyme A thioesterase PaaI-like protein
MPADTLMPGGCSVLTVEYKLNLVAPAVGQNLVTRAEVVGKGKRLKVCCADVFAVQDGQETLCATSLSTIMTMFDRRDG